MGECACVDGLYLDPATYTLVEVYHCSVAYVPHGLCVCIIVVTAVLMVCPEA